MNKIILAKDLVVGKPYIFHDNRDKIILGKLLDSKLIESGRVMFIEEPTYLLKFEKGEKEYSWDDKFIEMDIQTYENLRNGVYPTANSSMNFGGKRKLQYKRKSKKSRKSKSRKNRRKTNRRRH